MATYTPQPTAWANMMQGTDVDTNTAIMYSTDCPLPMFIKAWIAVSAYQGWYDSSGLILKQG